MRFIFFLLTIPLLIFLISCDGDDDGNNINNNSELIIGHWERTSLWKHVTVIDPTFGTILDEYTEDMPFLADSEEYRTFRYDNTAVWYHLGENIFQNPTEVTYSITGDILNQVWTTVLVNQMGEVIDDNYIMEAEYFIEEITNNNLHLSINWDANTIENDALQISTHFFYSKIFEIPAY